jgi:hypothetical protein
MKTPFNFIKNVFGKKEIQKSVTKSEMSEVHAPQKPPEVIQEEKKEIVIPEHKTKVYRRRRQTNFQEKIFTPEMKIQKIRDKRNVRNRMQKASRIVNRSN